jgi:Dissimilatory sulfite reductase (desulfoviridin), alpha and beta subunits
MEWTKEAKERIAKVPFFIRNWVKKRVEEETRRSDAKVVTVAHVQSCQKEFLHRMEDEVKGYQVETCFGSGGCPNQAVSSETLMKKIETKLAQRKMKAFLKEKVVGPLKFHHEFRVSLSDCPNACSRHQIVDISLIGARKPLVTKEYPCNQCAACVEICPEKAISLAENDPFINQDKCLSCGKCIAVCPTGTLHENYQGFRIQIGGKLGRHPQLGRELPEIYSEEEALNIIDQCLDYYQQNSSKGERLGEIMEQKGFDALFEKLIDTKLHSKVDRGGDEESTQAYI